MKTVVNAWKIQILISGVFWNFLPNIFNPLLVESADSTLRYRGLTVVWFSTLGILTYNMVVYLIQIVL